VDVIDFIVREEYRGCDIGSVLIKRSKRSFLGKDLRISSLNVKSIYYYIKLEDVTFYEGYYFG